MIAETVIRDAQVLTMAQVPGRETARAVAVAGGRILAVGSDDEISPLVGPGTQVLDLRNKTLLPGFFDTHVHMTDFGLGLLGPNVYGVTSLDQVLATVADLVLRTDQDDVVMLLGYDEALVDRPVSLPDLDRVAPHHQVFIVDVGAHASFTNTAGLAAVALPGDKVGIRRSHTGAPTGELVALANGLARDHFFGRIDESRIALAVRRVAELAVRCGVTTVHALVGGNARGKGPSPERDVRVILQERSRLPVGVRVYFQSTDVAQALGWHLPCIGGCILVDGAYGEHTAALLEPYADDPTTRGLLYFSDEELNAFVERAHLAGLQISMHAIGDAAIEQLLTAYERALTRHPRPDHRHRIEHFSLPLPQHIDRAARLGVAVGMQPNFAQMPETGAFDEYQFPSARFLGPERFRQRHPYRTIVDAGILVAGGSDADAGEMGPMLGVHALVGHPDRERRLSVREALSLYTVNGARIGFEEQLKGTIEPGKQADLVVLDENPLTAEPRRLKDIAVAMTIVGGKVVYDAKASSEPGQP